MLNNCTSSLFFGIFFRFLEFPAVTKSLETLIDHVGVLYKFHSRPVTFLYNTLHYYERRARERPSLRRKLVSSITGALADVRPRNWCLSQDYLDYLAEDQEGGGAGGGASGAGGGVSTPPPPASGGGSNGSGGSNPDAWVPDVAYYIKLVGRLTLALQGKRPFPPMDWRFSEFPNEGAHALYVTCVEVMALHSKEPATVINKTNSI